MTNTQKFLQTLKLAEEELVLNPKRLHFVPILQSNKWVEGEIKCEDKSVYFTTEPIKIDKYLWSIEPLQSSKHINETTNDINILIASIINEFNK